MTQQSLPLGDPVTAKPKRDRATVALERAMRAVTRSIKGKQDKASRDAVKRGEGLFACGGQSIKRRVPPYPSTREPVKLVESCSGPAERTSVLRAFSKTFYVQQ